MCRFKNSCHLKKRNKSRGKNTELFLSVEYQTHLRWKKNGCSIQRAENTWRPLKPKKKKVSNQIQKNQLKIEGLGSFEMRNFFFNIGLIT